MKTRSSPSKRRSEKKSSRESPLERLGGRGRAFLFEPAETSFQSRVVAQISADALQSNYEAIRAQVPDQAILPMIKADAYGHGAEWAARQLMAMPDLYGFGVATMGEGETIRQELGPRGRKLRIVVASGAVPWNEEKGQFCERYHLTPVIGSDEDFHAFVKGKWHTRIPYEIKFNTGMNRLGLSMAMVRTVVQRLSPEEASHHPTGILSHLAMAEAPDSKLSMLQRERFETIRRECESSFPSTFFHLANSAGIWNAKKFGLDGLTDVVRPGISLYGVEPWSGAPLRGLEPVMTLQASVISIRRIKPGESVGYGGRYVPADGAPESVAIVAAGYADGLHRMLSGFNASGGVLSKKGSANESRGGLAWVRGGAARILGVVSMDLSAVSCPSKVQVGDWVEFLGPHVDIWEQAHRAGTIPYELLTSVSSRVERIYG